MPKLKLKYDFNYADLFQAATLSTLDTVFLNTLHRNAPELHALLLAYRHQKISASPQEISDMLIACAKELQWFLIDFFDISEAFAIVQTKILAPNPIARFKNDFVLRSVKKQLRQQKDFPSFATLSVWLNDALKSAPVQSSDAELAIALLSEHYLSDPDRFQTEITQLTQWCVQAILSQEGQEATKGWSSLALPQAINAYERIHTITIDGTNTTIDADVKKNERNHFNGETQTRQSLVHTKLRERDGFKLTDARMNTREIQNEVHYCIYCHDHNGDFCSKGFPVKKGDADQGFRKNIFDVFLTGCPLEEKISEAQQLQRDAHCLAALAIIMIDNPMCPATGHRICNDCMKGCIYQKQDPVNIPQIETAILSEVLNLPWGVELYDLLTRWNPLCQQNGIMQPDNGLKIMIAGMGPAGFTLAHYLLQAGCAVLGFDGLKIEPLPKTLLSEPIYAFSTLYEALDERVMLGFGGVAEYGITARWDKNFLKLIYLSLMRRPNFQVFGNVRFGGTLLVDDAWHMGFHHFVIAVGAGLPKALSLPGSLAPGMRQANDFLMALQLGEAAKQDSLTPLQVRLPALVIGGGLTGVDTATELQAYYITQVEKIAYRYHELVNVYGEARILDTLDVSQHETLAEYLKHAAIIQKEREEARKKHVPPNFIRHLRAWGGVTIVYRRKMQESPAYVHNHEELSHALEEGIYYLEELEPVSVELDQHGHVEALICKKPDSKHTTQNMPTQRLPARSILVATGTQPNIAYEFEHRGTFQRSSVNYQHYEHESDETLRPISHVDHCKIPDFGPFTSYQQQKHYVSLIGDTHPVFHGSVVKAIASAKKTYPKIMKLLNEQQRKASLTPPPSPASDPSFSKNMDQLFHAHVHSITRHHQHVIELIVHAPIATQHFQAGQFYRLQNFSTQAIHIHHTRLQLEPLSLIAAACDQKKGLLTFLIIEHTASTKLCATLQAGDPIALMGPTGVRAKISKTPETILIIGDATSVGFTHAYAKALEHTAHQLIYLVQFKTAEDVYYQRQLEQLVDHIIWASDTKPCIPTHRTGDEAVFGQNTLELFEQIRSSKLIEQLHAVNRIFLVGSADLLRTFQNAREMLCERYFHQSPQVLGSVYGNMQCMLKGVCAQCFQWQIDPITKKRSKAVFACSWQDQPLELIDIEHLQERLQQNILHEHLNQLWVDHLFAHHKIKRI